VEAGKTYYEAELKVNGRNKDVSSMRRELSWRLRRKPLSILAGGGGGPN
jgi:hypothetical protein